MAIRQQDEIVALGREPISAERPVGEPCRYDEDFEELQGQLDRLGSLTGEEVQWPRVVELATELLKNKSKDLLVMTYLVLGLFDWTEIDAVQHQMCRVMITQCLGNRLVDEPVIFSRRLPAHSANKPNALHQLAPSSSSLPYTVTNTGTCPNLRVIERLPMKVQ